MKSMGSPGAGKTQAGTYIDGKIHRICYLVVTFIAASLVFLVASSTFTRSQISIDTSD
jgi:hypothetical protein